MHVSYTHRHARVTNGLVTHEMGHSRAKMICMGLQEFANEIRERRGGRISQVQLAMLSGVSERTIERLEARGGDAPAIKRNTCIDLAAAVNWDPDDALALLGEKPMDKHERAYLETEAVHERLERLWRQLTPEQQQIAVAMIAAMVIAHAPPPTKPRRARPSKGLKLARGAGTIPVEDAENAEKEDSPC